jgi:cytoskeletal protein CcmA (bactofilin family)
MADKTTVIGERTKVNGNLEGDEDLVVKGRVEGAVRLTKTLHVESGGAVVANVNVKDCVISGVVVGDVSATDSVHITDGGRMVGDINAPRVIIVAGAAFRGRVDMGDLDSERAARPRARAAPVEVVDKTDGVQKAPVARPTTMTRATAPAVAPRIASAAAGGKALAPPAPPVPGGKKTIKKK